MALKFNTLHSNISSTQSLLHLFNVCHTTPTQLASETSSLLLSFSLCVFHFSGSNATVETHVFCAKHSITDSDVCDSILARVTSRLYRGEGGKEGQREGDRGGDNAARRIILTVPINAPDSRALKLIIREGEQHDLMQYVHDFFELYGMDPGSVSGMVAEVNKR